MTLRLRGSTSGYAEINAPAVAGDNSLTLPTTAGTIRITNPSGVDGDYTVATGATITGSSNTIRFDTGANPPVQMDSNGHVGIGTNNNTTAALDVHGDIRISRGGRGDGTGKIMFGSDSGDYLQLQDIGTGGNIFELVQDGSKKVVVRGTNGNLGIGTDNPTKALNIAQNGDCAIRIDANNSNTNARTWEIVVGGNASNNAEMVFRTRQDDGTGGSECARIKRNGTIKLPSGGGIDFSATADGSGASNVFELLDDYEEGTFTPTFNTTNSNVGTISYDSSNTRGEYVKIGRKVFITLVTRTTGISGSAGTGNVILSNLPFAPDNTVSPRPVCSISEIGTFGSWGTAPVTTSPPTIWGLNYIKLFSAVLSTGNPGNFFMLSGTYVTTA